MKTFSILLTAVLLAVAGCGDDEETAATSGQRTPGATVQAGQADAAATKKNAADDAATTKKGDEVEIVAGGSEFGEMLFDSNKQAIYIFEKDPKGETVCYDECAAAWPPVFTDGKPVAGKGVKPSLLDTVKRRDGKLQVTYAGQPLYYYAHEAPGEVRCHNVHLNGGLWWVVGPDGKRRP
jgi:predicted lipoprotein with Yx(FWY)xxD motif